MRRSGRLHYFVVRRFVMICLQSFLQQSFEISRRRRFRVNAFQFLGERVVNEIGRRRQPAI